MSTLVAQTISNGSISTSTANVINGAKAWVNFDGTTSPGTIRASYNVSSITRNGDGDFTVNFTNAFADANYSSCISGGYWPGVDARLITVLNTDFAATTTSFRIRSVFYNDGTGKNSTRYCVSVFR